MCFTYGYGKLTRGQKGHRVISAANALSSDPHAGNCPETGERSEGVLVGWRMEGNE